MVTSNWILCAVFLITCHVYLISGSLVVGSSGKDKLYVTDYCPKMEFCAEGAHVMCMYYNPKSVMGPRCANHKNVSMTPDLANRLLDVSNEIRSKLAKGTETGKDGEPLPRAYGMFRLKWDTELATFAQVLANQCVLRHDLCRATKRFPNPGQVAGMVRFSIPDWFPISKSGNFSTPGLIQTKLLYATEVVLKSWYTQKKSVTPSMITNYPDWTLTPKKQHGRLYMELIHGSATHMGCGISAYTEYAFHDNNAPLNYNSVMIICNYSAHPTKGTASYNTVPPTGITTPFNKCGCPAGSEEDDACLCQVVVQEPHHIKFVENNQQCPEGEVCEPTVVLMPIFTVEDAPPEKHYNHDSYAISSINQQMKDVGMYHPGGNNLLRSKGYSGMAEKYQVVYDSEANGGQKQSHFSEKPKRPTNHQMKSVRNRYFDKKQIETRIKKPANVKKDSIFNKAPRFALPSRPPKPVVVPRKDFSSVKRLLNNYLSNKRKFLKPLLNDKSMKVSIKFEPSDIQRSDNKSISIIEEPGVRNANDHHMNEFYNVIQPTKPSQFSKDSKLTTEIFLNTAEQNLIHQDVLVRELSRQENEKSTKSIIEKNENKLITLLNTLEKEVKHAELGDKDKQLLDAKIKKLYGKMDPKEDLMFEKYRMKMENPDEFALGTHQNKSNYNLRHHLASEAGSHNYIDKYDETAGLYKKRFNLRGMKHSDFSHEQLRNRYRSVNRKSYDFDFEKSVPNVYDHIDSDNTFQNVKDMTFQYRNHDFDNINGSEIFDKGRRHNSHRNRNKNYYLTNDDNDPLSIERRRYYQEKLDNIQSRLENRRNWSKRTKNKSRQTRPVLPRENQLEYRHGNARYEHGYR